MTDGDGLPASRDGVVRHWLIAAAIFVALAALHTWPLVTNPARLSLNDNADAELNTWIVAWIAHQLPRHPTMLFQGNIFYPARDALAFSEPLIVPALLAAPLLWLGASPVLAHNVLLLAGLTLTGFAGYAAAYAWTRDRLAALTAGSLVAFNAQMLTRLAHLQAVHAWGLPLAVLLADALVMRPRRRRALTLAAVMAAMGYTSGYLIVFGTVAVAVVLISRAPAWLPRARQVLAWFALASVVAGMALVPVYLPYHRVAVDQGMTRSLESVGEFSASPAGYLAAGGSLHAATWSARFLGNPVDVFFPGITALMLAAAAIWIAGRERTARARVVMLLALGIVGVTLSLGLRTPIYGWLFAVFPPMQGLRAAARFGTLFLIAIALLASLGLAGLRRRMGGAWGTALALAVVAAVNVEALRAPIAYRRFDGIPRIYETLAQEPGPVVLAETPFYPPHAAFENGDYVLNATAHWRPVMNGYSGYIPRSYRDVAWTFWYFPQDRAIRAMRDAGVTHITVHPRRFGNEAAATIDALSKRDDLELMAIGARREVLLYRFK